MKKALLALALWLCTAIVFAQNANDPKLNARLATYMDLTRKVDIDRLMNFMHPSLFKIAPRAQMVKLLKQVYDNDQLRLRFDSTAIQTISAPFKSGTASYRQVTYYMEMSVHFHDTSIYSRPGLIDNMSTAFEKSFEGADVSFNKEEQFFLIKGSKQMMAIRDNNQAPWLFLGIESDKPELMRRLLPKAVISHFKLL